MREAWYVGMKREGRKLEAFSSIEPPRQEVFPQYLYVIGPMRTHRAALWAEMFGDDNPHFRHADDAERLSKRCTKTKVSVSL